MKQLDKETLLSLGFKEDGFTNISPDFYLNNDDLVISVNLKRSCDKDCGIYLGCNDLSLYLTYHRHALNQTLYLEQLTQFPKVLSCSGLQLDKEMLDRNGFITKLDMQGWYKFESEKYSYQVNPDRNYIQIFYNREFSVLLRTSSTIYCSQFDFMSELIGGNKRIW